MTLTWAIHRLSGISSPANAAYSRFELVHQLKSSGAKALFTCLPLLSLALEAASECGIPRKHVYLLPVPKDLSGGAEVPTEFKTVDQLIELGHKLPPLEKLRWAKGQGARQVALLCYSSGTSGLPVSSSSTLGDCVLMRRRCPVERCHDSPSERDRERLAMCYVREAAQRFPGQVGQRA